MAWEFRSRGKSPSKHHHHQIIASSRNSIEEKKAMDSKRGYGRTESFYLLSSKSNHEERNVRKIPTVRGADIMRNPKLTKSTAFTLEERQVLGIHGLLPPAFNIQELQMQRVITELRGNKNDLQRYIQLMALQARNERLFYRCLMEHTEELMPIVYTPTVGLACQEYGLIFRDPRGLFICIHDLGHVGDIVANWPEQGVKAICMTDGERILGLGDLGCNGMGIPIGKLSLYTACAGIHPSSCLPIMIDVGTDNEKLLKDPMYIGLRQKRDRSRKYDLLIDEIIDAIRERYGPNTLIQFEDFGNHNAFRFLEKYRRMICTFNDDIQGTAAVAVAGILASMKITKMKLSEQKFLFQGAGEAAIGIAKLLVLAMEKEGIPKEDARQRIWLVDSKGLIVKVTGYDIFGAEIMVPTFRMGVLDHMHIQFPFMNDGCCEAIMDRAVGGLNDHKKEFAHKHEYIPTLEDAVKKLKPSAIIGVAAVAGAFTETICRSMASFNEHPIIFSLSNPTSKAECTAEQAYTWTEGKCLFASGSPFSAVTLPDGRKFTPGQGNNAYIFPGLALGIISCSARNVSDEMFLTAAKSVAEQVTCKDLEEGRLYPPLGNIQTVSFNLAVEVVKCAYKEGLATVVPEPADEEDLIRKMLYDPEYISYIPKTYEYPEYGSYMCK